MTATVQTPPPPTPQQNRRDGPVVQSEPVWSQPLGPVTVGLTAAPRGAVIGLVGLRLAIGFEFLWAFFDKTFGLGYGTSAAHAWINGGSPTKRHRAAPGRL